MPAPSQVEAQGRTVHACSVRQNRVKQREHCLRMPSAACKPVSSTEAACANPSVEQGVGQAARPCRHCQVHGAWLQPSLIACAGRFSLSTPHMDKHSVCMPMLLLPCKGPPDGCCWMDCRRICSSMDKGCGRCKHHTHACAQLTWINTAGMD